MENQEFKKLNERILNDMLKTALKRRFIFQSDLYNSIISFMRINLIDTKRYKLTLNNKPENEYSELPTETDYMFNGSITDTETGDIFDFDIYYTKTRNNEIYPIEYIIQ